MSLNLDRAPLGYLPSGLPVYPIGGAEPRGINARGDILTQTKDGADLNAAWNELQASMNIANEQRTAFDRLFTFQTTSPAEAVIQSVATGEFERSSEYGLPVGARTSGAPVFFGATMDWFDLGGYFTWRFLRDASIQQVQAFNNGAIEADSNLTHAHVLAAVMLPQNRVNENDTTVYSLYNGDGMVPPPFSGKVFDGSHNHYVTTGSATLAGEDVAGLIRHVTEHGYGTTSGARVVVLVNPDEADTTRGFRVASGDPFDFIPSEGSPTYLTDQTIVGSLAPASFNGLPIAGSFGPAWVVEDALVPSGYLIAVATGGSNSPLNVVQFREHTTPALRGLRLVKGRTPDYPLIDSVYSRGFGTGVRHRGAAAVLQVTANATYTAPALVVP